MKKTNDQYTWGGKRTGAGRKPEQFIVGTGVVVATLYAGNVKQVSMTITGKTDNTLTVSDGITIISVIVTQ